MEEIEETPGPGNYSYGGEFGSGSKGFSIGAKLGEKYNENPGPGSYRQSEEVIRTRV